MNILSYYLVGLRDLYKQRKRQMADNSKINHIAAELVRNTHSIEKGLCIENPRLGFGHQKLDAIVSQIKELKDSQNPYHQYAVNMAIDAIKEYLEFHKNQGHSEDFFSKLEEVLHYKSDDKILGGTLNIDSSDFQFDISMIERFFNSRHSIRDYSKEEVDDAMIEKALILAQKSPSACNRQGVRTYVVGGNKLEFLIKQLPEIGGFADAAKRIIIITGKTSAYRSEELYQYTVSASMYAAYLSLTLHLYGMGACIVQRPVIWTNSWEKNRVDLQIPNDEQIVCMMTVGKLKDTFKVPISNRMGNAIYKFL